jgi:hypothetical protein
MIKDSLGNTALLELPKRAFLYSRRCPVQVVLKSYDWAIAKRNAKTCVLSGKHSQIEKDVLRFWKQLSKPQRLQPLLPWQSMHQTQFLRRGVER